MNATQIDDYWPFLQAMKEGKTVQRVKMDGEWVDLLDWQHLEDWKAIQFRIKPEKKLRAWKDGSEVPVGKVVKSKADGTGRYVIESAYETLVSVAGGSFKFTDMLHEWTMDDGSPCGVEEAQ